MGKQPCPFGFVAHRGRNSGFSTLFDTVFSRQQKVGIKNAVGVYAYGVGKQEKGADILRIGAL